MIANIFLHYGFDMWMVREFPTVWFERFADDVVVVHCVTERQARQVWAAIGRRFADIGLLLHPDKTRLVYCKDYKRHLAVEQVTFTFCGYLFRPREAFDRVRKRSYTGFLPAVAPDKLTEMSRTAVSWRLHRRTTWTLDDLAKDVNPVLRGWLNYFTVFYPSAVTPIGRSMDRHLMRWARRKYKRLERSNKRARTWLKRVRRRSPDLFAHWALRY
jgi:RNA-directed DNA polymerase